MDDDKIIIYTDGSCDLNPGGNGGWAYITMDDERITKVSGFEPKTTNQRMELEAVIRALQNVDWKRPIVLYTDSAYVCDCINKGWWKTWFRNGWKTKTGEDVKNIDLWQTLIGLIRGRNNVSICKVKGHDSDMFNNECDRMAKEVISFMKKVNNQNTDT